MTYNKNKLILNIIVLNFLGVVSGLFSIMLLMSLQSGFLFKYRHFFIVLFIITIVVVLILGVVFLIKKKEFLYKIN